MTPGRERPNQSIRVKAGLMRTLLSGLNQARTINLAAEVAGKK